VAHSEMKPKKEETETAELRYSNVESARIHRNKAQLRTVWICKFRPCAM